MNRKEGLLEVDAVDEIVDWSRFDIARNFRNDKKDKFSSINNKKRQSNERLDHYIEPTVKMWMNESFTPTAEQLLSGSKSKKLNLLSQVFKKTEHDHTLLVEKALDNMLVDNDFLATRYCLRKLLDRPGFSPTQKQRTALLNIEGIKDGSLEIAEFFRIESAKLGAEQSEKMKQTGDIAKSEMPKLQVENTDSMRARVNRSKNDSNAAQNMAPEINYGFKKMNDINTDIKKHLLHQVMREKFSIS
jgi:hypothetical protein